MSRTAKIWLITAASLVLVGCVLFVGVMSTLAWDFTKLSTVRYGTVLSDSRKLSGRKGTVGVSVHDYYPQE